MDETIPVIPLVNGQKDRLSRSAIRDKTESNPNHVRFASNTKKVDPDVKRMMEGTASDFNVTKMSHKKTKEEEDAKTAKNVAGTSSWVIIVMAVVVILLICAIVYLVLKYNETCDPPPKSLLDHLKKKRSEVVKNPPPVHQKMLRPRMQKPNLNVPTQPPLMPSEAPQDRGTKAELMEMLQRTQSNAKLVPIQELEPSEDSEEKNKEITPSKSPNSDKKLELNSEVDDSMVTDFYRQMELNSENNPEVESNEE